MANPMRSTFFVALIVVACGSPDLCPQSHGDLCDQLSVLKQGVDDCDTDPELPTCEDPEPPNEPTISMGLELENGALTARYCSLSYNFNGATTVLVGDICMVPGARFVFPNEIVQTQAFWVTASGGCKELNGEFDPYWGRQTVDFAVESNQTCKFKYLQDPAVAVSCWR
jgi:hypothetical protein